MSIFSDNLRYLRESRNESQQKTAEALDIKRGRYEPYESGKVEPPYEMLVRLSRFYGISIDLLLTVDLRKYDIEDMLRLADNRIVLPIAVDQHGENLIEVVPHKARLGYASGYADPEFIESLQTLSLPFLRNGKFRAFPASGDSMPPHRDSSYIIGKHLENLGDVSDGKTYILVTKNDGIVYKRLSRNANSSFTASSDNIVYAPYVVEYREILEVWEFVCSIETEAFAPDDVDVETVRGMFQELRKEIRGLRG
ncbi:helix-turn-helix domain-containing protein [Flavobacterium sp. MAH-1]|uniref:Helix-turn-helix domain-containing protein n=1 Tax=Flavobacterium agri TaxID=2743471 RepID=A0A7Y8Y3Q3_9FLAO|nr:helix-turn-helix domain-containing protein [Flavobacterium agri]NUY81928.1 helix-turn-helix domain-containing protein [Flavobacterium agri]NYA71952.1 helix-turn-helix domain-containing protein [Flavobacterium agri]